MLPLQRYPPTLSKPARALVSQLLHSSPTERLGDGRGGVDDLERHPFFAQLPWQQLLVGKAAPPRVPPPQAPGQAGGAEDPDADTPLKIDFPASAFAGFVALDQELEASASAERASPSVEKGDAADEEQVLLELSSKKRRSWFEGRWNRRAW